jgi:hypothetical protein
MQMQTIPMYELEASRVGTEIHVVYRRFYGDRPTTVKCDAHNIISHEPYLKVRLKVPDDIPRADMHRFEGQEVLLVRASTSVRPLNNGE